MNNSSDIIILVGNITNFSKIQEYFLKYPTAKVFSLNFLSHTALSTKRISHEIGENFLTEEDYLKINNLTKNATTNWYTNNEIKNYLEFSGINLGSLIEMELHHYFLPVYTNAILIKYIVSKINPKLVITTTDIDKYVKQLCDEHNIECFSLEKQQQHSLVFDNLNIKINLGKYPISLKISRKTYSYIKNKFEKIAYLFLGLKSKPINKKSILLVDFNPILYDDLLNHLSKLNKTILLLNTRRPAVWNFNSFKILFRNKCKIISLSKYERNISTQINLNLESFFDKEKELWKKDDVFQKSFSINSLTLWPSIKESFKKITDTRFSESIKMILLLNEFLSEINPSVILEWSETAQEEKMIIQIAKKLNIKTVYLQHAMAATEEISKNMGYLISHLACPFLSDQQIVWGYPAKEYALSHNNKNVLVTGSPRHDKFFNFKNNSDNKGIILFAPTLPSAVSSENITTESIQIFNEFIQKTCKIVNNLPNKKLLVKPHPTPALIYDIVKLVKEVDPNITITYGSDLLQIINNCELVITTNNSTIAIDAMMLNKPVISLQTQPTFLEEQIVKMGAVISITKISDIEITIKKLIEDTKLQNDLLVRSKSFLDHHFANQGNASKQLAKILNGFS